MGYSNDQTQIRAGLINYIGALLKASQFEDRAARQNVAAILVEETIKIAQDDNKVIDLYVIKPMIKGIVFTLQQRIQELSNLPKDQSQQTIEEYKDIIKTFEKLLNVL